MVPTRKPAEGKAEPPLEKVWPGKQAVETLSVKKIKFKEHVEAIHPYEPGKPIKEVERELGLRKVVKLASNENPLGPSRKALRAMRRALKDVHLYPEGSCHYLIQRLAAELGVKQNQLIAGNGSNEILELLARGFLEPGDDVISSETSFLVYPILTQACGARFVSVPMKDWRYDLDGILAAVTEKTRIIFIANPNNPTGTWIRAAEMQRFLDRVPEDVLVCVDEAYLDFVEDPEFPHMLRFLAEGRENLVMMRTFSKSHGLAGLRVGYAVGPPSLIAYLHKIRQPFNVNLVAQAGATAALDDRFFIWRTKRLTISGRNYFYRQFRKMGLNFLQSQANFVLVDTGCDGQKVFDALLRQGMVVRSMKAYGLPTWIRVTVGRRSQNVLFCRLLRETLKALQ